MFERNVIQVLYKHFREGVLYSVYLGGGGGEASHLAILPRLVNLLWGNSSNNWPFLEMGIGAPNRKILIPFGPQYFNTM